MDGAVTGLIGVVIGGVITTGSNYLLAIRKEKTDARNERQKWRRDRCLDAYADVLQAFSAVYSEAEAAYGAEPLTPDDVKLRQRELVVGKVSQMNFAAERVSLLCPRNSSVYFTS